MTDPVQEPDVLDEGAEDEDYPDVPNDPVPDEEGDQ